MVSSKGKAACAVVAALLVMLSASALTIQNGNGTIFTVSQSEDGELIYFTYTGDYRFDDYMTVGSTDLDALYDYLQENVTCGKRINGTNPVNCSAICVDQDDGTGYYAGRNFDFRYCTAGLVFTDPSNGYSSVSTVDLRMFGDTDEKYADMRSDTRYNAVAYIPMDGLNEKGVFICINSVSKGKAIDQHEEGKVSMFTTSALRLVLDHADSTEKAIELISDFNLNCKAGHHLFICDSSGDCRTVEYVDNKMYVTETRLLTNHYLTSAGDTPATESSLARYAILADALEDNPTMSESQVRTVMESVMQNNEDKVHYTRWSVVYDLDDLSAGICIRIGEDFDWNRVYTYSVREDDSGTVKVDE